MFKWHIAGLGLLAAILAGPGQAHGKKLAVDKVEGALSVMVLGSGGPVATPEGRASAGYLIFTDGKPRILMDAGGGTFKSLAKSGVNVKDLDLVLLSHLHIDHTSDLSAIIKTIYFHNAGAGVLRDAPIHIWGPVANGVPFPNTTIAQYPSTTEYIDGHYAMPSGVERYLNIFTKAIKAGTFSYLAHDLGSNWPAAQEETVLMQDGLKIISMPVKHGPVPAVAYRIEYKGNSIVYSGDTNSEGPNMAMIAKGADILIYDTAIMDTHPNPVMFQLHTTPSRMGEVAAAAMPKKLVLSHITPNTASNLDEVKALIRAQGYTGKIKAAKDLKVFNLGD
ncbi:MAG TPA: MBL fold metallo-hydrolase [Gammaproteobacteria bacterium]|nr:MBL fold metallo-hydrolase [Gammaproteobacteria bacterium]